MPKEEEKKSAEEIEKDGLGLIAEVRDALGSNLCRCGTYQRHPVAALEAAKNP